MLYLGIAQHAREFTVSRGSDSEKGIEREHHNSDLTGPPGRSDLLPRFQSVRVTKKRIFETHQNS